MGPRRRSVVWAATARQQLDEALAHVAEDSPKAASRLLKKILAAVTSLEILGERGRVVPECSDVRVRELLVDPFRLVYEVRESHIIVLAVLHQRQDFARWAARDLRRPDAL